MQSLPNKIANDLKSDAKLLQNMVGIYPGDSNGSIMLEVFVLERICEVIESVEWAKEIQQFKESTKITVTYE